MTAAGSPPPPSPSGALPPPPPPGVLPPPPPPSGVLPTVTQVEAYFEAQKNFLKTCKSSNLIFTAAVTGPNSTLVLYLPHSQMLDNGCKLDLQCITQ